MDNSWKTSAWNWDSCSEDEKKKGKVALFRCYPGKAFAVRVTQDPGSSQRSFISTPRILETLADWDTWLNDVRKLLLWHNLKADQIRFLNLTPSELTVL